MVLVDRLRALCVRAFLPVFLLLSVSVQWVGPRPSLIVARVLSQAMLAFSKQFRLAVCQGGHAHR